MLATECRAPLFFPSRAAGHECPVYSRAPPKSYHRGRGGGRPPSPRPPEAERPSEPFSPLALLPVGTVSPAATVPPHLLVPRHQDVPHGLRRRKVRRTRPSTRSIWCSRLRCSTRPGPADPAISYTPLTFLRYCSANAASPAEGVSTDGAARPRTRSMRRGGHRGRRCERRKRKRQPLMSAAARRLIRT